jgi:Protein of unknown function (DUF3592)
MVSAASSKSLVGGGCLALFGLPFLAAGVFLSFLYFSGYVKWWNAKSWVETPCWIESTELEKSGSDSDSHKLLATYRYEFGGHVYQGDRVSLYEGSDNVGDFHEESYRELSHHVKGATSGSEDDAQQPFSCYVNPENPSESVIYRTLRWEMQAFMSVFALTSPAVGAGLVLSAVWGTRMMRKKSQIASISHDSNMSSNNVIFYRVRLTDVLGKKKTLADGIKGSTTAEALAGRLEAWKKSG